MAFNDPSTVEALRWYASLSTEYGVKPVFGTDFAERDALISSGRAAMWTF